MLSRKLLFSLLVLILSHNGIASCDANPLFSVLVSIDHKGQNAWTAKDAALSKVELLGLPWLVRKLCLSKDHQRALEVLEGHGRGLLHSMRIQNQVSLDQGFKAQVMCAYNANLVQNIFAQNAIPFTLQDKRDALLIIDNNVSGIDPEVLQQSWKKAQQPLLVFHTGFFGLQERALWKQYEASRNVEPLLRYYTQEYPNYTLVWARYSMSDSGQIEVQFFCSEDNFLKKIGKMSWDAKEMNCLDEVTQRCVDMIADWWKNKKMVNPWEEHQTILCKNINGWQEWADFKRRIIMHPRVRSWSIASLSKTKGCVSIQALKVAPYEQH